MKSVLLPHVTHVELERTFFCLYLNTVPRKVEFGGNFVDFHCKEKSTEVSGRSDGSTGLSS